MKVALLPLRGAWELWKGEELLGVAIEGTGVTWFVDAPECRDALTTDGKAWREAFERDPWGSFIQTYLTDFAPGVRAVPVLDPAQQEKRRDQVSHALAFAGNIHVDKEFASRITLQRLEADALRGASTQPVQDGPTIEITSEDLAEATRSRALSWRPIPVGLGAWCRTTDGPAWITLAQWGYHSKRHVIVHWATPAGESGWLECYGEHEAPLQRALDHRTVADRLANRFGKPKDEQATIAALTPTWRIDRPADVVAWWRDRREGVDVRALDHPAPQGIEERRVERRAVAAPPIQTATYLGQDSSLYELTIVCSRKPPPREVLEAVGADLFVKALRDSDWPATGNLIPFATIAVLNVSRTHAQAPGDLWAFAKALADAGAGVVLRREPMMMPARYTVIYDGRDRATDAQGLAVLVTAHREADERARELELQRRAEAAARWKPDAEAEDWGDVRAALIDEPDKEP